MGGVGATAMVEPYFERLLDGVPVLPDAPGIWAVRATSGAHAARHLRGLEIGLPVHRMRPR